MKANIEELETNSKIKSTGDFYRDIIDSKKVYQPRNNSVKDEKGDLVAYTHSILCMCKKYFSQLLNIHGIHDVRQTELHTAGSLVPE